MFEIKKLYNKWKIDRISMVIKETLYKVVKESTRWFYV